MRYEEKISGGKLVAFDVSISNNTVQNVVLTGDFFLYPEETAEHIEENLTGIRVDENHSKIKSIIDNSVSGSQLVGASTSDLTRVFEKTLQVSK